MEESKKKSINSFMRSLHRDIGFFIIGLTIIYSLSGTILIYRDTDFLKSERNVERKVEPNTPVAELGKVLHVRDLKILKEEGDIVSFQNGTYNKATGTVNYTSKELPWLLNKFSGLHKAASGSPAHWFTTIFGVLLLFMAISSFWMYKKGTKLSKRGYLLAGGGILFSIVLLLV
jgi:hypothetical protein